MKHLLILFALILLLATNVSAQDTGATLTIDAIALDAPIIESPLDHRAMWIVPEGMEIGRLYGTAQLGASGNSALAAHVELANGSAGVFARLHELEIGDQITLILPDGATVVYLVTERYVTHIQDLTPLYPTNDDRLTLITCHTFDQLRNAYTERLIVVAARES